MTTVMNRSILYVLSGFVGGAVLGGVAVIWALGRERAPSPGGIVPLTKLESAPHAPTDVASLNIRASLSEPHLR